MTRANSTCRACGHPVIRARNGRQHIELDPDPAPGDDLALAVSTDATQTVRCRELTDDNPTADPWERMHTPHTTTCPARATLALSGPLPAPPAAADQLAAVLPFRRPDPAQAYRGRA